MDRIEIVPYEEGASGPIFGKPLKTAYLEGVIVGDREFVSGGQCRFIADDTDASHVCRKHLFVKSEGGSGPYRLPAMAGVAEWTVSEQTAYVASRLDAVERAHYELEVGLATGTAIRGDLERFGEAVFDLLQSVETLARVSFSDEQAAGFLAAVEAKNRGKGLYGDE